MEWIDVKVKHFCDIKGTKDNYTWESDMVDEPFMVAIPTNDGWCIQQVILTDEVGLECHTDDDGGTYFGWNITDVTHWFKPTPPRL